MRFAHLADLHLTETPNRSDVPLEEQEEILGRIATAINESDVDAVLIAGDCYDGTSTPRGRIRLRWFLDSLDARSIIIRGNHDDAQDLNILQSGTTSVYEIPGVTTVEGFDIALAPWPCVRNPVGYAAIVRGLRAQCGEKAILLAHCDLVGAQLDGGQDTSGRVDAVISADDLAGMGWAYCALGHYHKRQLHPWGGYSGGIRPMKFGDDSRKGVVIVDLDTGKRDEIDCAGYSLVTVDLDLAAGAATWPGPGIGPKDRVRIRYTVAEDDQEKYRRRVEVMIDAALHDCHPRSVVIEPEVIPTVRVRAPEIAAAKTDDEILRAYLRQAGVKRVEEIVKKSEEIKP